jgi:hypothetical protein
MDTTTAIVIGVVVIAVLVAGALILRQRRSKALKEHYGAEYRAAVEETGDRHKAEAELRRREKRVKSFDIRPLGADEARRFRARWADVQAHFVDDPGGAIAEADALLGEVMQARGYPVSDFDQRAEDLSVEHPKLVSDYRIAHDVAMRHDRGDAGTEDLRRAMLHYRELFEDLVEPASGDDGRRPPERRTIPQEDMDDERAAGTRDPSRDEERRRADDRTAGQRRGRRSDGHGRAADV